MHLRVSVRRIDLDDGDSLDPTPPHVQLEKVLKVEPLNFELELALLQ